MGICLTGIKKWQSNPGHTSYLKILKGQEYHNEEVYVYGDCMIREIDSFLVKSNT